VGDINLKKWGILELGVEKSGEHFSESGKRRIKTLTSLQVSLLATFFQICTLKP